MAQTRLEKEAIEKREEITPKNEFYEGKEYSEKDAQENGKGSGAAATPFLTLGTNKSKTTYTPTVNTSFGGSEKDINERRSAEVINLYNKDNQYGPDIIDTSKNEGQIHI